MTDKISEERKERVFRSMKKLTAYREIQNLMGRCAAACNFKQVQKIYAYFSERVDISCEIADEGLFQGREGVEAILNMVFGGEAEPGDMLDIQLTSPMIEVAGDLQTARGVWWTAGAASVPMGSKDPQAFVVVFWDGGALEMQRTSNGNHKSGNDAYNLCPGWEGRVETVSKGMAKNNKSRFA